MSSYEELLKKVLAGKLNDAAIAPMKMRARELCNELGQELSGVPLQDADVRELLQAKFAEGMSRPVTVLSALPLTNEYVRRLSDVTIGGSKNGYSVTVICTVSGAIEVYYSRACEGGNLR